MGEAVMPTSNVVGLYYDTYGPNVQVQILRDLLALEVEFDGDFDVYDDKGMVPPQLLEDLHLTKSGSPPTLAIRYRVGDEWPKVPQGIEIVDRDLHQENAPANLDTSQHVGYYLRPQGRDGASLTERYLSRAYPRGSGVTDTMLLLLWG